MFVTFFFHHKNLAGFELYTTDVTFYKYFLMKAFYLVISDGSMINDRPDNC
jgi:hypothetical protein